jgi:hypothetical protein
MLQVLHLGVAKVNLDVAFATVLHMYVASVCSKCFICFSRVLQLFHLCFAKIDPDVAIHILQVYVLNVSSLLDVCCNCFIWVLQI